MSPKPKPIAPPARESRTLTLAHRTEALLTYMAKHTGVPRGRMVDLAMACLEICPECHGTGATDGPMGSATEICPGCAGNRVRPAEGRS